MIDREDLGSWMEGPRPSQDYPGQRMGRPDRGPGSIARFGRRVLGLCLDWLLACALAWWLLPYAWLNLGITGLWFLLTLLAVGATGHSIGHLVCGMQVQTLGGRPAGFAKAFVRTVLTVLVVPPLIMDADQRGLHDRAASTVLVRVR